MSHNEARGVSSTILPADDPPRLARQFAQTGTLGEYLNGYVSQIMAVVKSTQSERTRQARNSTTLKLKLYGSQQTTAREGKGPTPFLSGRFP